MTFSVTIRAFITGSIGCLMATETVTFVFDKATGMARTIGPGEYSLAVEFTVGELSPVTMTAGPAPAAFSLQLPLGKVPFGPLCLYAIALPRQDPVTRGALVGS